MLKLKNSLQLFGLRQAATFGWLCVETERFFSDGDIKNAQPPSGGCVLKQGILALCKSIPQAATFGWLCVETKATLWITQARLNAATFGWLCVETSDRARITIE